MQKSLMKRRLSIGVLQGLISGVILIAVSYLASRLAGLIFPPFSLFDFTVRVLPGSLVTFGIDLMVSLIQGFDLGPTAELAKLAEQIMALVQFILLGGIFGGILAAFATGKHLKHLPLYGFSLGIFLAILFFGIEAYLGFPTLEWLASLSWLILLLAGWGLALGSIFNAMFSDLETKSESNISRRDMLYLGGSSLIAFLVSAVGLGFLFQNQQESAQPKTGLDPTPSSGKTSGSAASPSQEVLSGRIEPAPGTRNEITPNGEFYRIDINTNPPTINEEDWKLEITGLVDNPMQLTLEELRNRPAISQYLTLACISNRIGGDLISTALWTGLRLKDLLAETGLQSQARALYIQAADGFYETVVLDDIQDDRTLLVYAMNSQPLPRKHGFPLRIYIPNRYGMKQPKWIIKMEAVADQPPGYWVDRGWSKTAFMRTTSIIDAVTFEEDNQGKTLMGGIAHAGARGISKVEIQVDDGTWQEAQLRKPALSSLTWLQWRFEGNFSTGNHVAKVRAYDGEGELQILEENSPHPDGATGVHNYSFQVG